MDEKLKTVRVSVGFVAQHQLTKLVLGLLAGYSVSKLYDKAVVIPALQRIYDQNHK